MSSNHTVPKSEIAHYISYTRSKYANYQTIVEKIPTRDVSSMVFPKDCTSFELYDRIMRAGDNADDFFLGEIINREQFFIGKVYDLPTLAKEVGNKSQIYLDMVAEKPVAIVKIYGNEYLGLQSQAHVLLPSMVKFGDKFDIISQNKPSTNEPSMQK